MNLKINSKTPKFKHLLRPSHDVSVPFDQISFLLFKTFFTLFSYLYDCGDLEN